ncbi:MAG TPA: DUF357 domain-containing protein [Candidatus Nanoarchaeia archaeon]|nr:DUF357 domain-containing protein [Candidatus Nanoarchaeia archaeon]
MKPSEKKLDRYFEITGRAIAKVKVVKGKISVDSKSAGEEFLDMAKRYYDDAHYFRKKGDSLTSFAALNYAHGWLDAGARLGLFDVGGDNELFAVDSKRK